MRTRTRRPPTGSWLRLVILLTLALAVLVGLAEPARAHASFVSATPRPGTGLPQAPGSVVLRFSEPLVLEASDVTIRDQAGKEVVDGPTEAVEGDPRAMRRSIGLLAPGVYTVQWTTMSPLDGHRLTGTYRFAIGATTLGEEVVSGDPLTSEGPVGLFGTWLGLAGLAVWFGTAVLGRRARDAGVPARRLERLRMAATTAAGLGTGTALVASAVAATASWAALGAVVLGSPSGRWSLLVVATSGVALALRGWGGASGSTGLATVAVLGEAASGHAGSHQWPWMATGTFAAHLAVAGVWVSAVLLAVVARRQVRRVLRVLTWPAVVAAGAAAVSGVASAALQLTDVSELTTTSYGRTVAVKGAVFVAMALVGLEHRRRRRRGDGNATVSTLVRVEAAVGAIAIAVATLLVGFPNPPSEAAVAAAVNDPVSVLEATLREPAVTTAGRSGRYVVGVTLTPPRPGPVDVLVQIEGMEPGDAVRDVRVTASGSGGPVRAALDECGAGCFDGMLELDGRGRWRLAVHATTNAGPIEAEVALDLPAPDGGTWFRRMLAAMGELRSARVQEDLRVTATSDPIVSMYRFAAPDRMRWHVDPAAPDAAPSTRIAIGDTGYFTGGEPGGWRVYDWIGEPFSWPVGFYESFFTDAVALRVLGTERVEGTHLTVLAFAQTTYPAWYRVWLDGIGRVHRLEMLTDGHFMDQYYRDHGEPIEVRPPEAALDPE